MAPGRRSMRAAVDVVAIARPLATVSTAAGLALLALGLVAGCQRRPDLNAEPQPLRGTAYVMVGTFGQESINQALMQEQQELVQLLNDDFRQLHPDVKLQVSLARESDLPGELAARRRDGLSPDLMLVSGSVARELYRKQLSRPVPLTPELERLLLPHVRERLAANARELAGLPVLLEPQLACFNRRRLPASPTTVAALEDASERGIEVGLAANLIDAYWTVGALGANPALIAASKGQRLTPEQQGAVLRWLRWLRSANLRERVNFFTHQEDLLQGLMQGQLDWISCRSSGLSRLRQAMGDRLGVAVLPNGPGGAPTPLLRHRVWVFGRDSSAEQQQIAQAFAQFSISPMMQRYLTLHTQQMLPVSSEVSMPTGGSVILQAMELSEQQSRAAEGISLKSGDPRLKRLLQLFVEMIYGQRTPELVRGEMVVLLGATP